MRLILIIISAIIVDEICWRLILHSVNGYARREERIYDMSKHKEDNYRINKQTVYKVEGDFNGDIKGDNVTVILMGDGNFNGNINSKDGEVVLLNGNIRGDVKADKILCPTKPKTDSNSSDCFKCAWLDENGTCKSWDVNEGKCEYVGKTQFKTLWSCDIPQGVSPQKRTDHYTSIGNHVNIYASFPVVHIKCPHCKEYFATQVKIRSSVVNGNLVETSVEEIKSDY